MKPFTIDVPETVLADLKVRLARTRLPTRTPGDRWAAGTDPDYLRELLGYWVDGFDWRARERWLNSFPQYLADVGGQTVHFAHVRGVRTAGGPAPLPLVVTHGWPYSFAEMLPLVSLLTDPAAHGGDAGDAFDVVVPSLPGFGYSTLPQSGPVTGPAVAETWARLMTDVLGYPRFGTYGEDIGSSVSHWIAATHPDEVIGIHVAQAAYPPVERSGDLTAAEQKFLAWAAAKWEGATAYAELQSTRPDTLAAALLDSPSGLAAWMVEKFQAWSDCEGDVERRFRKDDLLTTIMIYWATGTIGSSFRPYFDQRDSRLPLPVLTVPAGITIGVGDLGMPRSLAERTYADIRYWHDLPAGGHFVANEEPGLVAADIREFFRPLRHPAERRYGLPPIEVEACWPGGSAGV
ncbi:epoxide hydrolase family protein [Streptomyces sp. H39-S7]|uniref:epoxide hydrolase family protein n=1 Tax=Streptomyces sp. H39-S7 TaxID=3004357 RepID=UPI0022AE92D3|nr:epoxide hydrolase family protein [Streptomyces sp. H39-S7]MCZ4126214.1 epoxide hydrolase [Streptomyces sp. H39-S7]